MAAMRLLTRRAQEWIQEYGGGDGAQAEGGAGGQGDPA